MNHLKELDSNYFSIVTKDCYDVTIMFKNTGNIWYIHNSESLGGKEGTLRKAMGSIKGYHKRMIEGNV